MEEKPAPGPKPKSAALKIAALSATAIALAVCGLIYWKYSGFKSLADLKISEQIEKNTGRKAVLGEIAFSPIEGLKLGKTCVKERDGKTDFFCFKKARIKVETLPALRGNLIFSDVSFDNGTLKLKRTAGVWNFSDLLEKLPGTNRPLHLNWNARNFSFRNFSIELRLDKESKNEIVFNDALISVQHRSNIGGNFGLKINSGVNANLGGNFISGRLSSSFELNFEYSILRSISGGLILENIAFGDITAEEAKAELEAFGMNGKSRWKKFELEASLKKLLIPAVNPMARRIHEKSAIFEKILGKAVQKENEFFLKELEVKSSCDGKIFSNSIGLDSNLLNLYIASALDKDSFHHSISMELKNMAKTVMIRSDAPIGKPRLKPEISETMDGMLKLGITELEKYLLKKIGD